MKKLKKMSSNDKTMLVLIIIGIGFAAVMALANSVQYLGIEVDQREAMDIVESSLNSEQMNYFGTDDFFSLPNCEFSNYPCKEIQLEYLRNRKSWRIGLGCGPACGFVFWVDTTSGEVLVPRGS